MTWRVTVRQVGHTEFDYLAEYASIGAVIYGTIAVTLDLGGWIVFYTIGEIIKIIAERKVVEDAKAVERVSSNPALLEQAVQNARTKELEVVGAK